MSKKSDDQEKKSTLGKIVSSTWKNIKWMAKIGLCLSAISGIAVFEEQTYGHIQHYVADSLETVQAQGFKVDEETPWLQEKLSKLNIPKLDDAIETAFYGRQNEPTITVFDKNSDIIYNSRNTALKAEFNDIDPVIIDALVAAEDGNFWKHKGWDLYSMGFAAFSDVARKIAPDKFRYRGASTITIQLADLLLPNTGDSYKDKMQELPLASLIEKRMSKQEILEDYLNLAGFGQDVQGQIVGIESASRRYFGKAAKNVSVVEAAFLVSVINKPTRYGTNVFKEVVMQGTKKGEHYTKALRRINYVLEKMREHDFITPEEFVEGRRFIHYKKLDFDRENIGNKFRDPEAYEYVNAVLERFDKLVQSGDVNLQNSRQALIHTNYDPTIQKKAREAFVKQLKIVREKYDADHEHPELMNGSVVVLDTEKHSVIALVGGLGLENKDFLDRSTKRYTTPGSTFKPFVLAMALKSGFSLDDKILDKPKLYQEKGMAKPYMPKNFKNHVTGRLHTLEDATLKSINTIFVELGYQLMQENPDLVKNFVNALGFDLERYNISSSIGTMEVSTLRLAGAYTVFLSKGDVMKNQFGDINSEFINAVEVLYKNDTRNITGIKSEGVFSGLSDFSDVDYILTENVKRGTGVRAKIEGYSPRGKTGTGLSSFLFAGYEPALEKLIVVSFASDNLQKTGPFSSHYTGGRYAAPVFQEIMQYIADHSHIVDVNNM